MKTSEPTYLTRLKHPKHMADTTVVAAIAYMWLGWSRSFTSIGYTNIGYVLLVLGQIAYCRGRDPLSVIVSPLQTDLH